MKSGTGRCLDLLKLMKELFQKVFCSPASLLSDCGYLLLTCYHNYGLLTPKTMYARIHVVSKKNNPAKLSAVEIAILENIADGLTTKEIAEGLGRREATIETYRLRILQKLDCRNSCEAVAFCLRNGIIK